VYVRALGWNNDCKCIDPPYAGGVGDGDEGLARVGEEHVPHILPLGYMFPTQTVCLGEGRAAKQHVMKLYGALAV
jgi:hypothetical protein